MAKKSISPRKKPRQARSRATVDALLQATADILVRDGYAKLTTNRIADRAGVNIASLYQFFPSKDALIAELRRRHVEDQRRAIAERYEGFEKKGVEATIREIVSMGIAAHSVAPRLHHVLTEQLPKPRERAWNEEDPAMAERLRKDIAKTDVPDPDLALWILDTAAHAVIHRAVVERPDLLENTALTDELVTLLLRYLKRR